MTHYGMVIDLTRCTGCQTCVVTCQLHHDQPVGIAWGRVDAQEWGTWPESGRAYLPHACMHCQDAPCVAACPTGASIQHEDGIVTVDYEQCIACGSCAMACPYDARRQNNVEEYYFGATEPAPYEGYAEARANVFEKCIFCADQVDAGQDPWCVQGCFCGARIFGDLDDPESDISAYIEKTGATNIEGTSMYYVVGDYAIDLPGALMVNSEQSEEKDGE